jgi:hypothetical protein
MTGDPDFGEPLGDPRGLVKRSSFSVADVAMLFVSNPDALRAAGPTPFSPGRTFSAACIAAVVPPPTEEGMDREFRRDLQSTCAGWAAGTDPILAERPSLGAADASTALLLFASLAVSSPLPLHSRSAGASELVLHSTRRVGGSRSTVRRICSMRERASTLLGRFRLVSVSFSRRSTWRSCALLAEYCSCTSTMHPSM